MIARNPRLGHAADVEDRLAFGRALVLAAWRAVSHSPGR
jgi:hypothetical protein